MADLSRALQNPPRAPQHSPRASPELPTPLSCTTLLLGARSPTVVGDIVRPLQTSPKATLSSKCPTPVNATSRHTSPLPAAPPSPHRTHPAVPQPFLVTPRLPIPSRVPPRATPIPSQVPPNPHTLQGRVPQPGGVCPQAVACCPGASPLRRQLGDKGTEPSQMSHHSVTHSPPMSHKGQPQPSWLSHHGHPQGLAAPCSRSVGTLGRGGAHPGTGLGAGCRGLEVSPVCRCGTG